MSLEGGGGRGGGNGRPEQDCSPTTTSGAGSAGLGSTSELWPNENSNIDNNPSPINAGMSNPGVGAATVSAASRASSQSSSQWAKGGNSNVVANGKKASDRARERWALVRRNLKQVIALKEEMNKYASITDRRKRLETIAIVDDAGMRECQQEILGELGVGEHVGSHAFLRNSPHAFSVIATQPCRYYTLQLTGQYTSHHTLSPRYICHTYLPSTS